MSKTPFMPLFFGDFLAATAEWDGEEQSLYLTMLAHQWSLGSLPADAERVRNLVRWDKRLFLRCWMTVRLKFEEIDGRLYNRRLEQHRDHAQTIGAKRSSAGSKGAASRWQKDGNCHPDANGNCHPDANGNCHPKVDSNENAIQSNPIQKKNPPTPRKRGDAPAKVPIPEGLTLDADLDAYVRRTIPDADPPALFEDFRVQATAKGWTHANWRAAFQTYVRNCRPGSGHFAAGRYPRAGGAIQWQ